MDARWQGICLWAVAMLVLSGACHAQSATPDQEYQKLIHVDQGIHPLGAHPFGENINPYNGSLSFSVTDVSLRGNGPTITVGRTWQTYEWVPGGTAGPQFPFGSWDLDIPRIETLVASGGGIAGGGIWQTGVPGEATTGTTQRCSTFTEPPGIPSTMSEGGWVPDEWWYGYNLWVPGEGKQQLMPRYSANGLSPTISGMSFPIVTKNNWMIGCGVTADDGGEGFLAIAPDGTRYTFAHLLYRPYYPIIGAGGALPPDGTHIATSGQVATSSAVSAQGVTPMVAGPGGLGILARRDALMYVTQIQDRFGNTLTYHYDPTTGYLSSITASDGREVDVTYVAGTPYIQAITAKAANVAPRTWTYSYDSTTAFVPDLTRVQLPDGSAWSYQLPTGAGNITFTNDSNCSENLMPQVGDFGTPTTAGTLSPVSTYAAITAPSGLTGTFSTALKLSGRSYTPQWCYGDDNGTHPVSVYPEWYVQPAITSEVLSGAGMPTQTWTYSYSPANVSWGSDACATSGTCPTTVYTDVTDPGGSDTRYTYSNRFDVTEGQLLRTDTYSGAYGSTLVRSVANTYANASGGPWPSVYGVDLVYRGNYFQAEQRSPVIARTITQGGDTYTWQAKSFNAYAQPTDVKRSNDIAGQTPIEETTAYLNDTNTWVLGLPETVTNVGTGEVESSNTYNSLDELTARARFGQTLMHYTWNSAGQLAGFTDGDNHATTLGSYVRGIPTAIAYPDGTHESLAVDDLGQITAITDQAGHTTHYGYDALGRIAQITYPYDSSIDSASWYPKTFSYSYVTGAERGLAAGHWRRTTTQGAATDTTWFDAELRPVLDDMSNGSTDISTATGYDWRGLTTFASYPVAGSPALSSVTTGVHSAYDALGRLTQTEQDSELGPLTTATAYLSGARKQVTDPKGNVTTTTYQVFDQPTYDAVLKVQAPTGITQTTTRDVYGHPLSITQSGSYGTESDNVTKSLTYDSYHRLCRTTEPETGSTIMAYDGANNLAWSAEGIAVPSTDTDCAQSLVPAAAQTARTYDAMNRVLTIAPPSGTQSTVYTYDALGHVHTAVSGLATQGYAYNSLGLLTGESLAVAGSGYSWALGYGYDAYGHRASVTYPAGTGSAETVSYAPDAWGRPTQAGSYATGVSYWPNGQVHGFTYVGGTTYLADQNARQLTSNFTYGAGSTLALSEDRAYDKDGNLTTVTDLVDGTRSQSFGYDALNRLTSASAAQLYGTESYTYDPINNLRTRLIGGVTASYNYDASNKLASITQGATTVDSFTYDAQGDEIAKNGTTLTYDAKHQLTGIPGIDSYAYDAAGRRVEKLAAGGSYPEYAFYDQAGQLMYRYAPGTGTATNYIYLGAKLVAHDVNVQLAPAGGIGFSANPSDGSTTVSWGSVPGASSYTLQQSANGGSWTTVYSGSGTSTTLANQVGGSDLYRVQACGSSNCGSWTASPTLGVRPALPTVTTPAGTVNGTYTVSWTAVTGATGYTVQERVNGGAWTTLASNTAATSISRPGTATGSYAYQVEALNGYGSRGWAASSAVTVNTAYGVVPTPVPTLTVPATSATGSVTVSWSAATPVTGYTLQQSNNGGTSWSTVYAGTATSAALSGLTDGSYTYRLHACNDTAGDSACTAWVTHGPLVVLLPPPTPASISIPATSSGAVAISWAASNTATSYILQHADYGVTGWSTIYTGSATSYAQRETVTGVWIYQVEACNNSGCSAFQLKHSGVTVTIPPASAPSLSVPATSSSGSYTVSWGAVSAATSYALQQSSNGGSSWSTAYSGSATSTALGGLGNGTYTYRVEACNVGGCGPWSATHAITVALIPTEPASITVPTTLVGYPGGQWTVSWSASSAATSYTLHQTNTGTQAVVTAYTGAATSKAEGGYGVLPGTYVYSVQACNANGCSGWRASSTVTVICTGGSAVALKPGTVQPDLIKCGGALAVKEGATP